MSTNKIEIQDGSGNVYYPKTSIDSVIYNNDVSIEEKIQMLEYKLNELKSQLADSINNKTGSSLTSNSTVDEMAAIINSIKTLEQATADANATVSDILVDKTAYVNGTKVTGTMPNKGAVTASLNCSGSYTIPAGYHNGSGKVTANSLKSQTPGTATANDIVSGKTAWVNGSKLTGTATIENLGGKKFATGSKSGLIDNTTIKLDFEPSVFYMLCGNSSSTNSNIPVGYFKKSGRFIYLNTGGTPSWISISGKTIKIGSSGVYNATYEYYS